MTRKEAEMIWMFIGAFLGASLGAGIVCIVLLLPIVRVLR